MYYDRTSSTDKSETTTSSNSGLGTFTAIAGVKYTPFSTLELRAGAGYKMSSTDYTTSQLNAAGNSTYSTNNPNHYAPFASATDPTSGQVATVAVTPTNSVTGTPLAEVGAKWSPLPRVAFFATASLSDPITTDTYYAYDTTTNKVWSQVNKSSSFNWSLGGLVGMAIRLSSNFTLAAYTGNLPSLGLSGSASSTNPGLPSSGGTTSNNLTGTSTTTSSNSFNAFVSGVITF